MSTSNTEWSSKLPTEAGYYLFTGSITDVVDVTRHYFSKLLEVRSVMPHGGICVVENEMDEVGLDSIVYVLGIADGSDWWHKLSPPQLDSPSWTSQTPTKEGVYFFQGIIQDRILGAHVLEFLNFKGSLTTCIMGARPAGRAKVGDCKGLWCEVMASPLPDGYEMAPMEVDDE